MQCDGSQGDSCGEYEQQLPITPSTPYIIFTAAVLFLSKVRVYQFKLGTITVDMVSYNDTIWMITWIVPTVGTVTLRSGDCIILKGIFGWVYLTRNSVCYIIQRGPGWQYAYCSYYFLPWLVENIIPIKLRIRWKLLWTNIFPIKLLLKSMKLPLLCSSVCNMTSYCLCIQGCTSAINSFCLFFLLIDTYLNKLSIHRAWGSLMTVIVELAEATYLAP